MSIVLQGSTSGSITLQEPAIAGSTVLSLPAVSGTILTTGSSGQSIPKAALPTGSVLQVVNAQTTTQTEASFNSVTDLGLSASITPTSSSSKILVLVSANGLGVRGSGGTNWNGWLVRGSTNIGGFCNYLAANIGNAGYWGASLCVLDSPATTSSTTYKLQGQRQTGSDNCIFNVNTGVSGTQTISTITLLEIAA